MEDYLSKTYTWEDINLFITNQAQENLHLEFKSSPALRKTDKEKREVGKDVAAFANAGGGLLIYGIEENDDHQADKISFVNSKEYSEEWLTQVITHNVDRNVQYKIDVVRPPSGKLEETIYVVKIPESSNTPHFAKGKGPVIRRNVIVELMEEYEVRAAYHRAEQTTLAILEPQITSQSPANTSGEILNKFAFNVVFSIQNIGRAIEKNYNLEIKLHKLVVLHSDSAYQVSFFSNHSNSEEHYEVYSFPNSSPFFQEQIMSIPSVRLIVNQLNYNAHENFPIIVKLYSSSEIKELKFYPLPLLFHRPRQTSQVHKLELSCFLHRE